MIRPGMHLHFDCASGAAGDMLLGALLDLGVPLEVVGAPLDALGVGRERLRVRKVTKGGVAATDVTVDVGGRLEVGHGHGHGEHHEHGDHPHVHYSELRKKLERVLEGEVKRRALDMFDRVARAEARIHGTSVEEVAFHEVGAIDSVVDIVGIAAALAFLAPGSASCARVAMGHGTVKSAHGVLPVPSPAAMEILREVGAVTYDGGVARELCTPTGAAALAHVVTAWRPAPEGVVAAIGWGAGDADLADRPNVVRAVAFAERAEEAGLWRVEANLDDMSPELAAHAADAMFAAGAVDVWWTPIVMKKGRPAVLLSALAPISARDAVVAAAFRETTTLGVRFDPVERRVLDRQAASVETEHGTIELKLGLDEGNVVNVAPEYESCRRAADRSGAALKDVYAAALAAWRRR